MYYFNLGMSRTGIFIRKLVSSEIHNEENSTNVKHHLRSTLDSHNMLGWFKRWHGRSCVNRQLQPKIKTTNTMYVLKYNTCWLCHRNRGSLIHKEMHWANPCMHKWGESNNASERQYEIITYRHHASDSCSPVSPPPRPPDKLTVPISQPWTIQSLSEVAR